MSNTTVDNLSDSDYVVVCNSCIMLLLLLLRWFSKCVLQNRGQEIIDALKGSLHGVKCCKILTLSVTLLLSLLLKIVLFLNKIERVVGNLVG